MGTREGTSFGVAIISTYFPSSRDFLRIGLERIRLTIRRNTSRISVILTLGAFLTKSCRTTTRRVHRIHGAVSGFTKGRGHRIRLGIVLRANLLGAPRLVTRTSFLTVRTNTSFVGASANGISIGTAPVTTCVVYRYVTRCCGTANGGVNFGPTNKVSATTSTLYCCSVISSLLKGR